MSTNKQIIEPPRRCPDCGSDNIKYEHSIISREEINYLYACIDCGNRFYKKVKNYGNKILM